MAKASALILLLATAIGMLLLLNSGIVQGNPIGQVDEGKPRVIIQDGLENLRGKFVCFFFTARKRNLRRLCFHRCLSVHSGGVADSPPGQTPPGQTPTRADTPPWQTPSGQKPSPSLGRPPGRHPPGQTLPWQTPPRQTLPL